MAKYLQIHEKQWESGQSLIETIVAIFVLTTGLAAGLALATFAFGASSNIVEQLTATALAREGIEAVRAMRDSNWLSDSLQDCTDIGQKCYQSWLQQYYGINPPFGAGQTYLLTLHPTSGANRWNITTADPATGDFRLYDQPSGVYSNLASTNPTNLFRRVDIIRSSEASPYTAASPLILVRVTVWWHGKNCPPETQNPANTHCKIVTEEFLTNWKNY